MDSKEFDHVIEDLRRSTSNEIDRLLIYIPSGALVFTMGFMKDIIPCWETAKFVILIEISWAMYAATIVSALLSHVVMHWVLYLMQGKGTKRKAQKNWNLPKTITNISLSLLFIGLILSVLFVTLNI